MIYTTSDTDSGANSDWRPESKSQKDMLRQMLESYKKRNLKDKDYRLLQGVFKSNFVTTEVKFEENEPLGDDSKKNLKSQKSI